MDAGVAVGVGVVGVDAGVAVGVGVVGVILELLALALAIFSDTACCIVSSSASGIDILKEDSTP